MDNKYMYEAIKEAIKAYNENEVPVGAVIVKNNKIIARAHNTIEKNNNATKHAEINAIEKASKKLKNWRLMDCDLYVTLEPCKMCCGAINASRIRNIYYLVSKKEDISVVKTIYQRIENCSEEYLELLQKFFKEKRG